MLSRSTRYRGGNLHVSSSSDVNLSFPVPFLGARLCGFEYAVWPLFLGNKPCPVFPLFLGAGTSWRTTTIKSTPGGGCPMLPPQPPQGKWHPTWQLTQSGHGLSRRPRPHAPPGCRVQACQRRHSSPPPLCQGARWWWWRMAVLFGASPASRTLRPKCPSTRMLGRGSTRNGRVALLLLLPRHVVDTLRHGRGPSRNFFLVGD